MTGWLKKHGGKELPFSVWRKPAKRSGNRNARILHNEKLETEWFKKHEITLEPPLVSDHVQTVRVNPHALSPFGYNGSVIEWNQRRLLAYRWHRDGLNTVLAIADLDANYNVTNNKGVTGELKSLEDPRLFLFNNELWISYVQSDWPRNPTCVTKYGKLVDHGKEWQIENVQHPKHGLNDGTALEKNWCPFVHDGKLHYLYTSNPHQSIIEMSGGNVTNVHHSDMPYWPWGQIKGGVVAATPYNGHLLRFFHSRLDNEPSPYPWRYYIGAAMLEPTPPFKTVAVSREPIVRASALDHYSQAERNKCLHYKTKIVFPSGLIEVGAEWHLSAGINDSAIEILKLKESDLKL